MLSKSAILQAKDSKTEKVEVPEWEGCLWVKSMSGAERDAWEASITGEDRKLSMDNFRAKLLVLCLCDEKGNLLFDKSDAPELGKKSAAVLDRLFAVAQKLNGLSAGDVDALKKT